MKLNDLDGPMGGNGGPVNHQSNLNRNGNLIRSDINPHLTDNQPLITQTVNNLPYPAGDPKMPMPGKYIHL